MGSGRTSSGAMARSVRSLARGLAQAAKVELLQVAHAAVDRLEAVPGRAGAEVLALDEGHRQASLRGVPGHRGPVDAAADHRDVPLARGEGGEVALHPRDPVSVPLEKRRATIVASSAASPGPR